MQTLQNQGRNYVVSAIGSDWKAVLQNETQKLQTVAT